MAKPQDIPASSERETARRLVRTGTGLFLLVGLLGLIPATDYAGALPESGATYAEAALIGLFGALTIAMIFGIWERAILPALATLVLAATLAMNSGALWPANLSQLAVDLAVLALIGHAYSRLPASLRQPKAKTPPVRRVRIDRPSATRGTAFSPAPAPAPRPFPANSPRPQVLGNLAMTLRTQPRQAENLFLDDFAG